MTLGQSEGLPAFVVGCALPDVTSITAELDDGVDQPVPLSPVIEPFGLRFAAAPVPEGTALVAYRYETASGAHRSSLGSFDGLGTDRDQAPAGWKPLAGNGND
ncbi:hypothetical protein [Wenjunlia tyrosinilytica]|nr:hypothetical protein [Wenjunlia tyrosinilytica]